jgi:YggT family protein
METTEFDMTAVLNLIDNVVSLYIWILFLAVIASWLINFNVINTSNRVVYMILDTLYKLTEPALRPIRRLLPNMGGLDLSPVVLILLLYFIRDLIFDFAR